MEQAPQATVLVAEDDSSDRGLLRYAFAVAHPKFDFQFVHDGAQVIQYLNREGQFADRKLFPVPELLVLDVNMPRLGGLEVLRWLETSGEFKDLKVILLTATQDPDVFAAAKSKGAMCLQKPADLDRWVELVGGMQTLLGASRSSTINSQPPVLRSAFDEGGSTSAAPLDQSLGDSSP